MNEKGGAHRGIYAVPKAPCSDCGAICNEAWIRANGYCLDCLRRVSARTKREVAAAQRLELKRLGLPQVRYLDEDEGSGE